MNDQPLPESLDDRELDLLADGELDHGRRRELLSRLDASPDGWKRCALAFLEAQAIRESLRGVTSAEPAATRRAQAPPSRSTATHAARLSAVALLLVGAFSAGWRLHPLEKPQEAQLAGGAVHAGSGAKDEHESGIGDAPQIADRNPKTAAQLHVAGVVTVTVDDHGTSREMRLPVVTGSDREVQRLLEQPPAIEASAVKALERRGHKVVAHRQLVAIDLHDGRRLVFPIEQIDVKFANRVYQ